MTRYGAEGTLERKLKRYKITKHCVKEMPLMIADMVTEAAVNGAQTNILNSKDGNGPTGVQPILVCTACFGDATHNSKGFSEKLLACHQCGISVHPSCAGVF